MWPAEDPEHNDEPDRCSRRGCLFQVPGWSVVTKCQIYFRKIVHHKILMRMVTGHAENLSFTLKAREPTFLQYIVTQGGHVQVHGGLY